VGLCHPGGTARGTGGGSLATRHSRGRVACGGHGSPDVRRMTQESSATSSRVEKVERKSGWTDRRLDWAVRAGVLLMRMLASTWRIRVVGYEGTKRAREAGEPLIFSLWHGELFPLLWQHRNEGARVLISEHRDG